MRVSCLHITAGTAVRTGLPSRQQRREAEGRPEPLDHEADPNPGLSGLASQADLARLKAVWGGIYSITCPDGVWSAYYIRTGEKVAAGSLRQLRSRIRVDYERRMEMRPGAPERMST
jgi:hypothetical protein